MKIKKEKREWWKLKEEGGSSFELRPCRGAGNNVARLLFMLPLPPSPSTLYFSKYYIFAFICGFAIQSKSHPCFETGLSLSGNCPKIKEEIGCQF
jgi:hypothetical protein